MAVAAVKVERAVQVDDGLVAVLALQRELPRLVAGQDGVRDLRVDRVGLVGVVRRDPPEYRQTCNFEFALMLYTVRDLSRAFPGFGDVGNIITGLSKEIVPGCVENLSKVVVPNCFECNLEKEFRQTLIDPAQNCSYSCACTHPAWPIRGL